MNKTEIVIQLTVHECVLRDEIVQRKIRECEQLKQRHTFQVQTARHPFYTGYTGEMAFAKWLQVPYRYTAYNPDNADVMGYQIKTTQLQTGCLIKQLHMPTGTYVLGIANAALDTVTFKGWALSQDIEQECYWRNDVPKPAWFMPQTDLWSMNELTETAELAAHNGTF